MAGSCRGGRRGGAAQVQERCDFEGRPCALAVGTFERGVPEAAHG